VPRGRASDEHPCGGPIDEALRDKRFAAIMVGMSDGKGVFALAL
jgi:hypothetical protein